MSKVDLKKVLRFDDSKFQVFDAEVTRVNLGLADEQGKRFNAMAKELDIAPLRLLRDTIETILTAYSIDPQMFIEESQRAHKHAAEAMHLAARDMQHRHIGPNMETGKEAQPPADYCAEIEEIKK